MTKRQSACTYTVLLLLAATAFAISPGDITSLQEFTRQRGGMCMVIGAPDLSLAETVAASGPYYVQTLQPDENIARSWGAKLAASPARSDWLMTNELYLYAKDKPGKDMKWKTVVKLDIDDIVLTPARVYAAGRPYSEPGKPELLALDRETGKIETRLELPAYPVYNGMSVAGKSLYIATRDGRVLCVRGE